MAPKNYHSQNRAGRIFRDFREHPRKDPRQPRLGPKVSRAQWVAKHDQLNWSIDILRVVEDGQPPLDESRLKDLVTFGVFKETDPFWALLVYAAELDWQEINNPSQPTTSLAVVKIDDLEEIIDAEVKVAKPEVIEKIVERIIEKEVIKEVPVEVVKEVVVEKEIVKEVPVEVIKEVVIEKAVEVRKEVIKEIEKPVEEPIEEPKDAVVEEVVEVPVEKIVEVPIREVVEIEKRDQLPYDGLNGASENHVAKSRPPVQTVSPSVVPQQKPKGGLGCSFRSFVIAYLVLSLPLAIYARIDIVNYPSNSEAPMQATLVIIGIVVALFAILVFWRKR